MVLLVVGTLGTVPKNLEKRQKEYRNQRTSQDHPDKSIIKISSNTHKSSGGMRKFAVTESPVKDLPLKLVWKTHKK